MLLHEQYIVPKQECVETLKQRDLKKKSRFIEYFNLQCPKCIIIIVIQPLDRSGQRPEFSQATGMALVRCILGKFLGIACHCFPPLFRCSQFSPPSASTSATT